MCVYLIILYYVYKIKTFLVIVSLQVTSLLIH